MEIPNIHDLLGASRSNANQNSSSTNSASEALDDTYDNFLLLLTKQLQNQDPLDPLDTAQFTQQLVSFSAVEQQINSNKSLEKLIALQSATNAFGAVGFLGNEVAIDSDKLSLKDGKASFQYNIDRNAAGAMLRITDASGNTVLVQEANRAVGTYKVDWNGKDVFGNQLPDGQYQASVSYQDEQGNVYSSDIVSYGIVDSTEIKDGDVQLFIGKVGFPIDKILRVTKGKAETPSEA
jgi:flagellar basal-body rod modification protein FlgD